MLTLYVTTQMIQGEVIRFFAKQQDITARRLGELVGVPECNMSRLLSIGLAYDKHYKNIIKALNITDEQVMLKIKDVHNSLLALKLGILSEESDDMYHVLIPSKSLQVLVNKL